MNTIERKSILTSKHWKVYGYLKNALKNDNKYVSANDLLRIFYNIKNDSEVRAIIKDLREERNNGEILKKIGSTNKGYFIVQSKKEADLVGNQFSKRIHSAVLARCSICDDDLKYYIGIVVNAFTENAPDGQMRLQLSPYEKECIEIYTKSCKDMQSYGILTDEEVEHMKDKVVYFKNELKRKFIIRCKMNQNSPKKMTIRKIADEIGFNESHVVSVLNGNRIAGDGVVGALCDYAGVEFNDYFEMKDARK